MKERAKVRNKMKKLQEIDSVELIRYELYAIITTLLLSKKEFSKNKDIKIFLDLLEIEFKEYVMRSRTLILSRMLREVEKADEKTLEFYKNTLGELYLKENKNDCESSTDDNKSEKNNYMNQILKKYSRNRG
ncbi:hypothetical protein [Dethiothermospora halolimnae]|uniref:hypothetical protein n=1 Tax=Dethiothermospora halolimnae TaxID=3114390 RepID=UPI003CCBC4E7